MCNSLHSVIERTYNHPYYIEAEIITLNLYPPTGHCFPELVEKEGNTIIAKMSGLIWNTNFERINERFRSVVGEPLHDGIKILCLASVEFTAKHGISLHIQDIEPSYTLGEMAKNKKEVIERLKRENIFEANRRKQLPLLPKRIAVISVETSKGYSDFIKTLKNNEWSYKFSTTLFRVVLQGEKAISTINEQLTAIEKQQSLFDCVAIIRGGGDEAGLSCYDSYEIASRVATFPLPVISGIGHSTNETVTELVSFANKITPTEVAYFIIQRFHDFAIAVQDLQDRCLEYVTQTCTRHHQALEKFSDVVKNIGNQTITIQNNKIENFSKQIQILAKQKISSQNEKIGIYSRQLKIFTYKHLALQGENISTFEKQLGFFAKQIVGTHKEKLESLSKQIALLHPDNVLKRGFSITSVNGHAITDSKELSENQEIITKFYKGEIKSIITSKHES